MEQEESSSVENPASSEVLERNRMEIIRFETVQARVKAIGVLRDCGMLNLTSYKPGEWIVRTPVVRALRKAGVPFEWLTERV